MAARGMLPRTMQGAQVLRLVGRSVVDLDVADELATGKAHLPVGAVGRVGAPHQAQVDDVEMIVRGSVDPVVPGVQSWRLTTTPAMSYSAAGAPMREVMASEPPDGGGARRPAPRWWRGRRLEDCGTSAGGPPRARSSASPAARMQASRAARPGCRVAGGDLALVALLQRVACGLGGCAQGRCQSGAEEGKKSLHERLQSRAASHRARRCAVRARSECG